MADNYTSHYKKINRVYPSVFALKVFLGKMPGFSFRAMDLKGMDILDIGFGDGRDLVLFHDLGMIVHGCEPEPEVVAHTYEKFTSFGIDLDLRSGTNMDIPFDDSVMDIVYSAGAIYYLPTADHTIFDAYKEVCRILKPEGYFIGSVVTSQAHYIPTAIQKRKNIYELTDPFFQQRKGQLIHAYNHEKELESDLNSSGFQLISIGKFDVDWFGVRESLILFIGQKAS